MTDTSLCPICGRPNECAVTAGKDPETCWCFAPEVNISDAVKAAVPADKRLQDGAESAGSSESTVRAVSCICADCIRRLSSTAEH